MSTVWLRPLTAIGLLLVVFGKPGPTDTILLAQEVAPFEAASDLADLCACDCHADPRCDAVTNVLDLVDAANVAFHGGAPIADPNPLCPYEDTDVDCSGLTDIIDVVSIADVAFRLYDPATRFCDPCNPSIPPSPGTGGSVVIESKQVAPGATAVQVGVYIQNDVDITGLTLPLEIREVTPGCFIANSLSFVDQGRVAASGLTDFSASRVLGIPEASNSCSGPISSTYSADNPADFASPDAVFWVGLNILNPCLATGTDGTPGSGTPSFLFTFDVTSVAGTFEIDTCCVTPGNHLQFVACGTTTPVIPSFTKSVITVGSPPGNSVIVESVTVPAGATGVQVGVYVENVEAVSALVLPLEIREIDAGAYMSGSFSITVQGRVGASGLTDFVTSNRYPAPEPVNQCSGPVSKTYITLAPDIDYVTPDGILWTGFVSTNPNMPAGSDGLPGVGTPSFVLSFDVTEGGGQFEIDTACILPDNHFVMLNAAVVALPVSFTGGTIEILPPTLVSSLADSGPGTLRWAIDYANSHSGSDAITLSVSGVIQPTSPLPALSDATGGTFIDGYSAPAGPKQAASGTGIVLDGSMLLSGSGLEMTSANNTVTGLTIHSFPDAGILVHGPGAVGNTIKENLIHGNGGLGIDLNDDGVTLNDPGDGDTGPNDLVNFPELDTAIILGPGSFYVAGTAPLQSVVELYLAERYPGVDTVSDTSGHGEGWVYLGSDTSDNVTGHFVFDAVAAEQWAAVTATATDALGNTSEFAWNRRLVPDSLIFTAYSPVTITVYSPSGSDSIGPDFNTFGVGADYDSLTDYGLGPDGIPGTPDDRVAIERAELGEYTFRITPVPGATGEYFFGIRVDGSDQTYMDVSGTGDSTEVTRSSEPVANALPPPGETANGTYDASEPPCACDCHADPECDGLTNVFDVVWVVNVAFREDPDIPDTYVQCWRNTTDADCDDDTDVFDVVRFVNVAFRYDDPAVNFCAPCP